MGYRPPPVPPSSTARPVVGPASQSIAVAVSVTPPIQRLIRRRSRKSIDKDALVGERAVE